MSDLPEPRRQDRQTKGEDPSLFILGLLVLCELVSTRGPTSFPVSRGKTWQQLLDISNFATARSRSGLPELVRPATEAEPICFTVRAEVLVLPVMALNC
jgi:hypothetical protein